MTDKTIALVLIAFMVMSSFASATHLGKATNKDSSKSSDKVEYDEVKALMEDNDKLDEEPRLEEDKEEDKDSFDFSVFRPKDNEDEKTEVGGPDSPGATQGSKLVSDLRSTLKLNGQEYRTDLFTGSASYTYSVEVPDGVNGLEPDVSLYYNHHNTLSIPGAVGSGWNLNMPAISRDVSNTRTDESDDKYILNLNGVNSKMIYVQSEGVYHTEHESYLYIKKMSGGQNEKGSYWIVKAKDGTTYRFGYLLESEQVSNLENYVVRWSLDLVNDTHSNTIKYHYDENPNSEEGTSYLSSIVYGSSVVDFNYNFGLQPSRQYYSQGLKIAQSGLLSSISVNHDSQLIRKYSLSYVLLGDRKFLNSIQEIGNNGQSTLPLTEFGYNNLANSGWQVSGGLWEIPANINFGETTDEGVRLVDVSGDGRVDILRSKGSNAIEYWEGASSSWVQKNSFNSVVSNGFVDSYSGDQGVRFVDANGDSRTDIIQSVGGTTSFNKLFVNTGAGFSSSSFSVPSSVFFAEKQSSCAPNYCPYGYSDNGIQCNQEGCTRICAQVTCYGNGMTVKDGVNQYPYWSDNDYEEGDSGQSFTPQPNKCYKFEFTGSPKTDGDDSECYDLYTDNNYYNSYERDCQGNDIDAYAAIGFRGNSNSNSWLSTLPYGNDYGYIGDVDNNAWQNRYISYYEKDSSPDTSGSNAGDWDGFNYAICDEAGTQAIHCAPTQDACSAWGVSRCGYGCANENTRPFVVAGVYADVYNDLWDALDDNWFCPSEIDDNDYFGYGTYKVMEYNTYSTYQNQVCSLYKDNGLRLADVNGDGKTDVLKGKQDERKTWINTGSSFNEDSSWMLPSSEAAFYNWDGSDAGVRMADINGDGLIDIIKAIDNNKKVWLNTGKGWTQSSLYSIPLSFVINGQDEGIEIIDLNSDGFNDFLKAKNSYSEAYVNFGNGWSYSSSWNAPDSSIDFTKLSNQISDVDAESTSDIVIAKQGTHKTYINKGIKGYLLSNIKDTLGKSISINYSKISDIDNTGPDSISDLAFTGWVVSKVEMNNNLIGEHNVLSVYLYNYSDGSFNSASKEFRGFGKVQVKLPDGSKENRYFYQDDAKKGLEHLKEMSDAQGILYLNERNVFDDSLSDGYYIVKLDSQEEESFEGQASKKKRTDYKYDSYGNIIKISYFGDIEIEGDERYLNSEYLYNNASWVLDKKKREYLQNSNFEKTGETFYSYDGKVYGTPPAKGDLTHVKKWLNTEQSPITTYAYDSYGNVIKERDALNRETDYKYDSTNRYVAKEINALGHVTSREYDSDGNVIKQTDANEFITSYEYDEFGRIIKEIKPYDSVAYPTTSWSYNVNNEGITSVTNKMREHKDAALSFDSYEYYDGFGNKLQDKKESENGFITTDMFYDGLARAIGQSVPYYSPSSNYGGAGSGARLILEYDSQGRIVKITNADGTQKSFDYGLYELFAFDENNHRIDKTFDAYGNIVEVLEYNGNEIYSTKYTYDTSDNVVLIANNEGDKVEYEYDILGRKIKMTDPDLGVWTYEYDANGNLLKQTDGRNNIITLSYDALNRVIKKSSFGNALYVYDNPLNATLSSATKDGIKINYVYDQRLRLKGKVISVDNKIYPTIYVYDSMDRLVLKQLPNKQNVSYIYDKGSMLANVKDIAVIKYNEVGLPAQISYQNGLQSNYQYYAENYRVKNIKTENIQNLGYSYDSVGNTNVINDSLKGVEIFDYDSLNRLVKASRSGLGGYVLSYSYDEIGNMIKADKDGLTSEYLHGAKPAHAPTSVKIYDSDSDLEVYYTFESIDEGKFADYSQHEREGGVTGAYVANSIYGKVAQFVNDDSVKVEGEDISLGSNFTFAARIKVDKNTNETGQPVQTIIGDMAPGIAQPSAMLFVTQDNKVSLKIHYANNLNSKVYVVSNMILQKGKWYHITGKLENGKLYLYIDGNLNAEANAQGLVPYSSMHPFYIGASKSQWFFNGAMDDAKIYTRALSAEEILKLL